MKKVEKKKQKKSLEIIGIIGSQSGMGCTHTALSIANYLCSVEKQQVLYLEMGEESSLLALMQQDFQVYGGILTYIHMGVRYLPAAAPKEAQALIEFHRGGIVIDFGVYREDMAWLLKSCSSLLVIGSLQPWCVNACRQCIEKIKNKKEDIGQMNFYCHRPNQKGARNFLKRYHLKAEPMPYLSNPFAMKEKDFETIRNMIYR